MMNELHFFTFFIKRHNYVGDHFWSFQFYVGEWPLNVVTLLLDTLSVC